MSRSRSCPSMINVCALVGSPMAGKTSDSMVYSCLANLWLAWGLVRHRSCVYSGGSILGYVSNVVFSKLPLYLGWQFMLGIVVIHSVFLTIVVMGMPESPHWLMLQWGLSGIKRFLRNTLDSLDEAEQRLAGIREAAGIAL
ncbi:hypothetical protein MLD38_008344 [Melastoma candidum]|uniref:Uncharacterized protein n=1 Tax=Melastoma candidum TaxID=119954 RepID=A0ACB9RUJ6_9MYRT|nr:hypothetical protein MLD38_008344 [Melastoma candidum]